MFSDNDIHRYYQLADRDSSTVSIFWKVSQIICLIITSISGYATAYCFGKTMEAFGDFCYIGSNIKFILHNTTEEELHIHYHLPLHLPPIDMTISNWGSMTACYFHQFSALVSTISAIVWATFFMMSSNGGAGYITDTIYRPWRLVFPALIFSGIGAIVMVISSATLSYEAAEFCNQFNLVLGITECTSEIDVYTLTFWKHQRQFAFLLEVSVIFSYLSFTGWLLLSVVLILRIICIADFTLIRITVTPKDEELVDLIGYDDDNISATSSVFEERTPLKYRTFSLRRRLKLFQNASTIQYDKETEKSPPYGAYVSHEEQTPEKLETKRLSSFGFQYTSSRTIEEHTEHKHLRLHEKDTSETPRLFPKKAPKNPTKSKSIKTEDSIKEEEHTEHKHSSLHEKETSETPRLFPKEAPKNSTKSKSIKTEDSIKKYFRPSTSKQKRILFEPSNKLPEKLTKGNKQNTRPTDATPSTDSKISRIELKHNIKPSQATIFSTPVINTESKPLKTPNADLKPDITQTSKVAMFSGSPTRNQNASGIATSSTSLITESRILKKEITDLKRQIKLASRSAIPSVTNTDSKALKKQNADLRHNKSASLSKSKISRIQNPDSKHNIKSTSQTAIASKSAVKEEAKVLKKQIAELKHTKSISMVTASSTNNLDSETKLIQKKYKKEQN